MLFITNRVPEGSVITEIGREFRFNITDNTPSPSMYFCQHNEPTGHITEIGSDNLIAELRRAPHAHLLFLLHGFSNQPQDVLNSARILQGLCNTLGDNKILVIPLIWPCEKNAGIFTRYWDDRGSASASRAAFSRVVMRLYDGLTKPAMKQCKGIHILAHSMGNYVLSCALQEWSTLTPKRINVPFFKNSFLVAADIEDDSLEPGKPGDLICEKSEKVVVYFAPDDRALYTSKTIRGDRYYRLGAYGPAHYSRLTNVTAVNCRAVNQKSDNFFGHSYYTDIANKETAPGKVVQQIISIIIHGGGPDTIYL